MGNICGRGLVWLSKFVSNLRYMPFKKFGKPKAKQPPMEMPPPQENPFMKERKSPKNNVTGPMHMMPNGKMMKTAMHSKKRY